jgi:ElaB/YqjD/DUF883 family membrane-anchored ribosome-binding protein
MSVETDRIEADLNESRHRLNDTLEALGSKLSPGQMLDEVLGLAQGQAGAFAGKLGRQVKDNPMPTLLIGAGIAWLMLNSRQRHHAEMSAEDWRSEHRYRSLEEARWATPRMPGESDEAYDERVHQAYAKALDLKQRAGEAVHEFKARVAQAAEGARSAAEGVRARIAGALSSAKHAAQHQVESLGHKAAAARHGAEDFYQETPLAAGAIALAVGAIIGSAMPLSRPERTALKGVADKAGRASADLAERGAKMIEEAVERPLH